MKKYYVNHRDGMTTDSEFVEIRDQLVKEQIIDPKVDRDRRRVRRPGGGTTDAVFLHLWDLRNEAEEFALKLRQDASGPRFGVIEVDVEGTLEEILDVRRLPLPASPHVLAIEAEPYVDSQGEDALQVRVIVEDKPDGGLYRWPEIKPIYRAVHDAISAEGIELYPYVHIHRASDVMGQRRHA